MGAQPWPFHYFSLSRERERKKKREWEIGTIHTRSQKVKRVLTMQQKKVDETAILKVTRQKKVCKFFFSRAREKLTRGFLWPARESNAKKSFLLRFLEVNAGFIQEFHNVFSLSCTAVSLWIRSILEGNQLFCPRPKRREEKTGVKFDLQDTVNFSISVTSWIGRK